MGNFLKLQLNQIREALKNLQPAIDAGVQDKGLMSTKARLEQEAADLQNALKGANSIKFDGMGLEVEKLKKDAQLDSKKNTIEENLSEE